MAFKETSHVGLDIGSTTAKIVVTDSTGDRVLFSRYARHHTRQRATAAELLAAAHAALPRNAFRVAVCGSGAEPVAECLGAFFVQEVTALAAAVGRSYPEVRTAIELGGQDAKVVTFTPAVDGVAEPSAMRMNGVCAGGTGAFIDQMAALLDIPIEAFDDEAGRATRVYDVSGRCGVFAKTDIQPLLNGGAAKSDLALSCFHAIVRQTLGGLAHGLEMRPDVLFAGGPLTFQHRLVEVFQESLSLTDAQIVRPEHPELFVALGAAIAAGTMFDEEPCGYESEKLSRLVESVDTVDQRGDEAETALFGDRDTGTAFSDRHGRRASEPDITDAAGEALWMGVDAGSTTCKFALLDDTGTVRHLFYDHNHGDPLQTFRRGMQQLERTVSEAGVDISIVGVGVTGYGAPLFHAALAADHRSVETVAHAKAARAVAPGVTAVIDIGGQDMKVIFLDDGVVTDIIVNEACSAGCGSFLESYADTLSVPIGEVASHALRSRSPAKLGSRCTVFMNSSIITEQRRGKSTEDVLAGLCVSVVQNVFEKVVRPHNLAKLGDTIVVEGGTFANDAVLRAAERYLSRDLVRPSYPKHMGAIGAALLGMEAAGSVSWSHGARGRARSIEEFLALSWRREEIEPCSLCANACARTVVRFSNGATHVGGNRCYRGGALSDGTKAIHTEPTTGVNLVALRRRALFEQQEVPSLREAQNFTIGIPRVLDMWETAPFWNALFRTVGFRVVYSRPTTPVQYDRGVTYVSSDTICLPAKIAHGHVEDLLDRSVDAIFLPQMLYGEKESSSASGAHYCAVVQGYPMVLGNMHEPLTRHGKPLLHPIFHWYTRRGRTQQIVSFLEREFGIAPHVAHTAIRHADAALARHRRLLVDAGNDVLARPMANDDFAVVMVGRPYHADRFINHDIPELFARHGVSVLIPEALDGLSRVDLSHTTMENEITFHSRVLATAELVARNAALEMVQIVSFGCGHDAVIADEAAWILKTRAGKVPLMLKVDDGSAAGPLRLRIDSFIETVRERRRGAARPTAPTTPPRYRRRDRSAKTIYVPNLSPAFSRCMTAVLGRRGVRLQTLPLADSRAFELGKRYVHNDICFPAQVNIGEFLACVERGTIDPATSALGLAKNCESCRASQYPAVARRALDAAGLLQVPIVTTGTDTKVWHPGFRFSLADKLGLLWGVTILDELERIARRLRPYEAVAGTVRSCLERGVEAVCNALAVNYRRALDALARAIAAFNAVALDDGVDRKPRVGIVGEILLNYHPTANFDVGGYLERHGMEIVIPDMHLFFRKNPFIDNEVASRGWSSHPLLDRSVASFSERVYDTVRSRVREVGRAFRFDEKVTMIEEIADAARGMIDLTYRGAEGWKIPGEIIAMADHGIESFVIVQPFGCLPNHVTGRGFEKRIKQERPGLNIISLDFDPDTSLGNIENRLQMVIMNEKRKRRVGTSTRDNVSERTTA